MDESAAGFELTAQVSGLATTPEDVCEQVHTAVRNLVSALERSPQLSLCQIDVLSQRQHELLLVEANATTRPFPRDQGLACLFEEQASRTPDAVAVSDANQSLSYRELNARANRLAHALRSRGVEPGDVVAVALKRSVELVVQSFRC